MTQAIATVTTANASRYLQQLCKHWSHKFPVDFTADRGWIGLPLGRCELIAAPETLTVKLDAANEDTEMARFKDVVEAHLKRFGFREALVFDWRERALA